MTSDAPHNGTRHPPPGTPSRHLHNAQRGLAGARAVGRVLGPPYPHHPCPGHTGNGSWLPAPGNRQPREGQRLTPEASRNDGRPLPRGGPPTTPAARSPPQGMQAKMTVLGPHARTPALRARGSRTPTARPEDGQPGGTSATPRAAPATAHGAPRRHPHGTQRQLARAHAVGRMRGPPYRPHRLGRTSNGPWMPRPPPEVGSRKKDGA